MQKYDSLKPHNNGFIIFEHIVLSKVETEHIKALLVKCLAEETNSLDCMYVTFNHLHFKSFAFN